MLPACQSTYRNRLKSIYSTNCCLILCIVFLIFCLILNQKFKTKHFNRRNNVQLNINRIRDIPINQPFIFNITHQIIIDNVPDWIYRYKMSHLFDYYWLQTGGYKWHLQQMIDLKYLPARRQMHFNNRSYLFDYLNHHPEYGVIIDTAPDPFQPIFPPLPRTSLSLNEICIRLEILNSWYPCYTRSEMASTSVFKPLFTYALYDVTINDSPSSSQIIHYDEIIYLFDNTLEVINETFFLTQVLPRLIRLLALVPQTAVILSPYFHSEIKYVNQYIDILIHRGVLNNRTRLIKSNSQKNYHANAVYSTSTPRVDLILLHNILIGTQFSIQREHILIIRNNLDDKTYNDITQTINLFEFPTHLNYLHIQEYNETTYSIKQFSQAFHQSLIVIGMPGHILSHIVWCLPGTHIIEIGQKLMTTDYYEISLQLKLNYWLALTTTTNNQIDIVDFRNLMMKVFTYLDI